jgi:hypothetical protein
VYVFKKPLFKIHTIVFKNPHILKIHPKNIDGESTNSAPMGTHGNMP